MGSRAAADRFQVHREHRRRIDLQQVPLARPRDLAAPHEDRVGSADRDASRDCIRWSTTRRSAAPARRRPVTQPSDGRPPDNRHPIEKTLDHLAKTFPLKTPEWTAWSANMRPARLDGTWALSGWELGKGAIYGRVTITASPSSPEEFTTSATYRVARTGETITRTGRVDRLHRFPVARPLVDAGRRLGDARSDDGRSQLAVDGRPLVCRRLRRSRHRREARARRRRDARARHRSHRAAPGRVGAGAEDLRDQPGHVASAVGHRSRSRHHGHARRERDARPRDGCRGRRRDRRRRARAICSWPARRVRRRSPSTTRSTPSR